MPHRASMRNSHRSFVLAVLALTTSACNLGLGPMDFSGFDICGNEPKTVALITANTSSVELTTGLSQSVSIQQLSPSGTGVSICAPAPQWASDNAAVAQVLNGTFAGATIVAVAPGRATVTAMNGSASVAVAVNVTVPAIAAVRLNVDAATLLHGDSERFRFTAVNESGGEIMVPPVTWRSSNSQTASVTARGTVLALDTGDVTISATTTVTGVPLTATVRVRVTTGRSPQRVQQLSTGWYHSCALVTGGPLPDGSAYCWGDSGAGALGTGGFTSTTTATPVVGGHQFRAIAAGDRYTCGLLLTGTPMCWGDATSGQLGAVTVPFSATPVPIATARTFTALAAASRLVCALTASGEAYCWGTAAGRQLKTPTAVGGGLRFASLKAGASHVCGQTLGGALHCWSVGDAWDSRSPVLASVTFGAPYVQLSPTNGHTCGLLADGTGRCTGVLIQQPLGPRAPVGSLTVPMAVPGGLTYAELVTNVRFTCGRRTTGGTVCIGESGLSNATSAIDAPLPLPGAQTPAMLSLSAGLAHMCGTDAEGGAWCWGDGSYGQLGAADMLASAPQPLRVKFLAP